MERIVSARFDVVPSVPVFIGLARLTFPVGGSAEGGTVGGPRFFLVESGEITIHVAEAATLIRAVSTGTPGAAAAVAAGAIVTLLAGDQLFVAAAPPLAIRNDGSRPAAFLDGVIFPEAPDRLVPYTTRRGVIFEPLVVGTAEELPSAPVEVRLDRLAIPVNGAVPLAAETGPRLFYVDSGTLGLACDDGVMTYSSAAANAPGAVAGRVKSIPPGREALLTAGGAAFLQPGAAGEIHNLGRNTLMLMSLSVRSLA